MKNTAVKVMLFICVANVLSLLALVAVTHYTHLFILNGAADYSFVLMVWFWLLTTLIYLAQPGSGSTIQVVGEKNLQRVDEQQQASKLNVCLKLFLSSIPAALFCLLTIEL